MHMKKWFAGFLLTWGCSAVPEESPTEKEDPYFTCLYCPMVYWRYHEHDNVPYLDDMVRRSITIKVTDEIVDYQKACMEVLCPEDAAYKVTFNEIDGEWRCSLNTDYFVVPEQLSEKPFISQDACVNDSNNRCVFDYKEGAMCDGPAPPSQEEHVAWGCKFSQIAFEVEYANENNDLVSKPCNSNPILVCQPVGADPDVVRDICIEYCENSMKVQCEATTPTPGHVNDVAACAAEIKEAVPTAFRCPGGCSSGCS